MPLINPLSNSTIMKLKEITPQHLNCGIGACPAIFETENGDYVLIGEEVSSADQGGTLQGRVGPGETVIKIPRGLIQDIVRTTK
jgi:hypothetical protein